MVDGDIHDTDRRRVDVAASDGKSREAPDAVPRSAQFRLESMDGIPKASVASELMHAEHRGGTSLDRKTARGLQHA